MKGGQRLLILFASVLAANGTIGAQSAPSAIRGVVTDTAGAPLRGVTIRLGQTEPRQISDGAGEFLFDRVSPGRHSLRATMIGAPPAVDSVVVRAGDTTRIRFVLQQIPFVVETLPPRYARGARPDTAPSGKETLDLVARVGGIPL